MRIGGSAGFDRDIVLIRLGFPSLQAEDLGYVCLRVKRQVSHHVPVTRSSVPHRS